MQVKNTLHLQKQNSHKCTGACIFCPVANKCSEYITQNAPSFQIAACLYARAVAACSTMQETSYSGGLATNTEQLYRELERLAPFVLDCVHAGWLCNELDGGNGFCEDVYAMWERFIKEAPKPRFIIKK